MPTIQMVSLEIKLTARRFSYSLVGNCPRTGLAFCRALTPSPGFSALFYRAGLRWSDINAHGLGSKSEARPIACSKLALATARLA